MTKKTFTVLHADQLPDLFDALKASKLPCEVTWEHMSPSAVRSLAQNRLMHKWFRDISKSELGWDVDDARSYCKLEIGIPILRRNEKFREHYDAVLKRRPYAEKRAMMLWPFELPVTSMMTEEEMTEFLDTMHKRFGEEYGVHLPVPDDQLTQQPSSKGTKWAA